MAESTTLASERPLVQHRTTGETWLIAGLLLSVGALLAVGAYLLFARPDYDPLSYSPDPRPIQRVAEDGFVVVPVVDGYNGPAVRIGETVPTTGQRCSTAEGPLDAVASLWWQRVGTSFRVPVVVDFPRTVEPGCIPLAFENDIPDEVAEYVEARGVASQWEITGVTTPTHERAVEETWRTEAFWVVPDE